MTNPTKIEFYHHNKPYYAFTNFALGYPINFPRISGWENLLGSWPSAEHLFQAAKFANWPECVAIFKNLDTSQGTRKAFQKAVKKAEQKAGKRWITDWHGSGIGSWENEGSNAKKIEIMWLIVEQKFRQHDNLKNLLLSTGDRPIIEDTESDTKRPKEERDNCWGNANNGKNWLGKILMELRTKLKNEETPDSPPLDPLASLKTDTIIQINREMSEDPEIKNSELQNGNQNWENSIQIATQKNGIARIYNQLKADIDTKRKGKKLAKTFQKLISQAQQAMQTGNSLTLNQLLPQIYNFREHIGLYSQHENKIRQWETYVSQQNANSFKILKINAINHLLQQEPKVKITELREFNRDFQRIIEQTSDFTKIDHFERQVSDNIIKVRTEKRFDQLLVRAWNVKSEKEKSLVIQEIYKWRDTTNKWESSLWQRRKSEVKDFLNDKWSSDKNNTEDKSHWLKQTFQTVAVGVSLVIVIWLLAKLIKKGRKF